MICVSTTDASNSSPITLLTRNLMIKQLIIHNFLVSLQIITYRDYLPLLLGRNLQRWIPSYKGYKESVDPRISNVFTLAFRFAHASIPPSVGRLNQNYQSTYPKLKLSKTFFGVWHIVKGGKSYVGIIEITGSLRLEKTSKIIQSICQLLPTLSTYSCEPSCTSGV